MNRTVGIVAATVAVFLAVVTIMLRVLPGPHRSTDYMVIGAIATFFCLLVLFLGLVNSSARRPNPFFKHRRVPPRKPGLGLRD